MICLVSEGSLFVSISLFVIRTKCFQNSNPFLCNKAKQTKKHPVSVVRHFVFCIANILKFCVFPKFQDLKL